MAEIYLGNAVNILIGVSAGFGIFFSILGGSLYAAVETHSFELHGEELTNYTIATDEYKGYLINQGWTLLVFLGLMVFSVFFTFLLPCIQQLEKNEV
jgi:hypothetical protein